MKTYLMPLLCLSFLFTNCKKATIANNAIEVINKGVSGNTTQMLINRINDVTTEKPDLVIVMIGTNDASIYNMDAYNNYENNLSMLIDRLKASGTQVMLLTPPPVLPGTYFNIIIYVDSICNSMKSISKTKNCPLVDINTYFKTQLNTVPASSVFLDDGVHPNAAGYTSIAAQIAAYMKANHITSKKIVCFGDSITYGIYLNGAGTADGDTYPAALKRILNAD